MSRKAKLAARLAKADLVTGMVGEFPELQGLMGRYYALDQGIDQEVADAIRDHYKPQGPCDSIPVSKIGQAVALADKLDTLVGFWAIDEKPTGSKDPYALRRAALGIIRIDPAIRTAPKPFSVHCTRRISMSGWERSDRAIIGGCSKARRSWRSISISAPMAFASMRAP